MVVTRGFAVRPAKFLNGFLGRARYKLGTTERGEWRFLSCKRRHIKRLWDSDTWFGTRRSMVQIHSPRPISFFPLFYLHIHFASVRHGISGARSQIRAAPHVCGTYARTKLPPAVFCDSQTPSACRALLMSANRLLGRSILPKQLRARREGPHKLVFASQRPEQILLRWFHLVGVHDECCPT
jgi:hypothetical protein